MKEKSLFNRRSVIAGAGATAVTLSLGDLLLSDKSLAAARRKHHP